MQDYLILRTDPGGQTFLLNAPDFSCAPESSLVLLVLIPLTPNPPKHEITSTKCRRPISYCHRRSCCNVNSKSGTTAYKQFYLRFAALLYRRMAVEFGSG